MRARPPPPQARQRVKPRRPSQAGHPMSPSDQRWHTQGS